MSLSRNYCMVLLHRAILCRVLLAPQSGAHRRCAYRDFQPQPIHLQCLSIKPVYKSTFMLLSIVTTNSKLEQQDNGQQWITMDNNGQQSAVLHASLMPFLTTYSSPHPLIQSQSDPSTLALHPSEVVFSNNFSQITSTYCSLHQSRLSHRGGDTRPWNISDNTQEPLSKNFPEEFCNFMCWEFPCFQHFFVSREERRVNRR